MVPPSASPVEASLGPSPRGEAGDRLAALIEGVHERTLWPPQPPIVPPMVRPASTISCVTGIGTGLGGRPKVIDIAAYAREIVRALEVEAAGGLLLAVAGVVDQGIADGRNDRRALNMLDRERGVWIDVVTFSHVSE